MDRIRRASNRSRAACPVETEMEEVERRPAVEYETVRKDPIPRDLLQQVEEPQHLLQRACLVAGLVR